MNISPNLIYVLSLSLTIDKNFVSDEGIKGLLGALEKDSPLSYLNLGNTHTSIGYNNIHSKGANIIGDILKNNTNLKTLILGKLDMES
jgi:hypothetical protein